MANRMSTFSTSSLAPRSTIGQSSQVSTTTLLNTLHISHASNRPYALDAATSLVINTSLQSLDAGEQAEPVVDTDLAWRAWEHARRRAEDGCIVLGSLHHSTPSTLLPMINALPLSTPQSLHTALSVLKAFTCHVTPFNPSFARHSSLAVNFTLNLAGEIRGASLALSKSGINTQAALLQLPEEKGYRAFDVFYYLLNAASTLAEREFLGLKHPSVYAFLNRSRTYEPPHYVPASDDAAAGDDFRSALKALGIKGAAHRNLLATLAGLLKLGDTLGLLIDAEELDDICEDVSGLLGVDPEVLAHKCPTDDRTVLTAALYECLVDWVIAKANDTVEREVQSARGEASQAASRSASRLSGMQTPDSSLDDAEDVVSITVVEIPDQELGKAVALRGVFDDTMGINSEMKDDGVQVDAAGASVLREMQNAVNQVALDLGIPSGATRDRERELARREAILERVGNEAEEAGFLKELIFPVPGEGVLLGKHGRFDLADAVLSSRIWYHLSLHPTDDSPEELANLPNPNNAWSAGAVSRQLRAWRLPEWVNRRNRNLDYTADFDIDEFAQRYSRLGCQDGRDGVESWIMERGWDNGDVIVGHERVWTRESAWWEAESMIDMKSNPEQQANPFLGESPYDADLHESGFFSPMVEEDPFASREPLLSHHQSYADGFGGAKSIAPTVARTTNTMLGDYGLGVNGDNKYDREYDGPLDPELGDPKHVTTEATTFGRRAWVAFVWAVTFWIPSFSLRYVGRMKRPDVRMAWREKVVLVLLIFLLNAVVVFYIVAFGNLLCPNFDKAWNALEVSEHQGTDDFYVSVRGKVYDITSFWQLPHSTVRGAITNDQTMLPFAGQDLDPLFPPPLYVACPQLVKDKTIQLRSNTSANSVSSNSAAVHWSGANAQFRDSDLKSDDWYSGTFLPKINHFYKGDLVWDPGNVTSQGKNNQHMWIILNNKIYDFSDYYYTQTTQNPDNNQPDLSFLPSDVSDLIQLSPGQDLTSQWGNSANFTNALHCMDNVFYKGITDFREGARCQVNNYILLAFTIILCLVILVKFLSALQFGSKRRPSPQDKFVICQVPAYTEGEDQLRKSLDSLTALEYDNKRKLICVICDGMIVGGGNDRPTPKIVLDILGVDPKIDPPALPFKSVGQGSDQLNYGKVYSGLYEFEGNVVPYIVVVKVGKESEQTKPKPGNRGKRDSQIMLMSFLNRVHHRAPMNPLELEIFHQINNIIGVDPELYEYLFMVDADTSVREDSLNRLVARCASDARIAGICGETSLQNEDKSWWTMIQVYEYYISHHLSKAFESLFGSVTCLPGCFCMYRMRTADKGRPLIISDKVIAEYSDGNVDTLHKKNLFSLGEDRYLTTLMTKHFPQMSYKFVADAYAATAAPESWGVLLSQRRRWINSTVHNLVELVALKDLCGFCCFSMRFVVFIDLFGTLILPATCAYLGYLIYRVATHSGQFPLISIIMIAAVYGLQALIFLLRRQWQHIGWMIIYILAFPIYSFILPIYSFWKQDDFSWGTTRIVIGEKGNRQIVALEDEGFDPRSIPLQRWDDYAMQQNLPGRRGYAEKEGPVDMYADNAYEMDDLRTVYSDARPTSTVLTGFHGNGAAFLPPQSPAYPMGNLPRHATTPSFGAQPYSAGLSYVHPQSAMSQTFLDAPLGSARSQTFHDAPQYGSRASMRPPMHQRGQSTPTFEPYHDAPSPGPGPRSSGLHRPTASQQDLHAPGTPPARLSRSPLRGAGARSPLRVGMAAGGNGATDFTGERPRVEDAAIEAAVRACLGEVDLERVTKKTVRAMVGQRLGLDLVGELRERVDGEIDGELARM